MKTKGIFLSTFFALLAEKQKAYKNE